MIRLGIRLAIVGGRTSAVTVLITTLAVAAGTAVMLFALSFEPALEARFGRSAWRNPIWDGQPLPPGPRDLLMITTSDAFLGHPINRIEVAPLGPDAPLPAGVAGWPGPGDSLVSPALARLLAVTPADQLGNRFGPVVGSIGEMALRSPNELAVVAGRTLSDLRNRGASQVTQLRTASDLPKVSFILSLLAALLAAGVLTPIGVFIATATRLTAASRERRLALLRLMGATQAQMSMVAAGEAACSMVPGAFLALVVFVATRPAVASIQVDGADWFVEALAPPLWQAILALSVVPLLGVSAAVVAVRRLAVSPLGAVRRTRPRRPSVRRLIPLGIAGTVFAYGVTNLSDPAARMRSDIGAVVVGFVGLVIGVAIAGPYLTALLGRALGWLARGPATLMAARRLADEPGGTFAAVSGVVMAAFVACTFSIAMTYAGTLGERSVGYPLRAGSVMSWVGQQTVFAGSDGVRTLMRDLRALPGTQSALLFTGVDVAVGDRNASLDERISVSGWITDCHDLVATLDVIADCSASRIWAGPGTSLELAPWLVQQYLPTPQVDLQSVPQDPVNVILPAGASMGQFAVSSGDARYLPDLLIDPSVLPDSGGAFAVSGIFVLGDGTAAFDERARTLIDAAVSGASVETLADLRVVAGTSGVLAELGRVVALATIGTLLIAGCSLAVSLVAALLDRRRPLALLRLIGMPVGRLRLAMLLEAAVPLIAVGLLSAALGLVAGQQALQAATGLTAPGPEPSVLVAFGAGLMLAMLVVTATLPLVGPVTATEATRFE